MIAIECQKYEWKEAPIDFQNDAAASEGCEAAIPHVKCPRPCQRRGRGRLAARAGGGGETVWC